MFPASSYTLAITQIIDIISIISIEIISSTDKCFTSCFLIVTKTAQECS